MGRKGKERKKAKKRREKFQRWEVATHFSPAAKWSGATALPAVGSGQLPTGSTVEGLRRNICTKLRIFSDSVKSSEAEPAIEKRLMADGEEGISVEESEASSGGFNASKSVFLTFDRRAPE